MNFIIVAVFDVQVGAYMRPMFVPSEGAAIRAFADEVNRAESEMHRHPKDYRLDRLGVWNEGDGSFMSDAGEPRQLAQAGTLLMKVN